MKVPTCHNNKIESKHTTALKKIEKSCLISICVKNRLAIPAIPYRINIVCKFFTEFVPTWHLSIHNVEYLSKATKCLKMKTKIKY